MMSQTLTTQLGFSHRQTQVGEKKCLIFLWPCHEGKAEAWSNVFIFVYLKRCASSLIRQRRSKILMIHWSRNFSSSSFTNPILTQSLLLTFRTHIQQIWITRTSSTFCSWSSTPHPVFYLHSILASFLSINDHSYADDAQLFFNFFIHLFLTQTSINSTTLYNKSLYKSLHPSTQLDSIQQLATYIPIHL